MSTIRAMGQIMWHDLTVDNASELKNFYREVVGWTVSAVPMKDYVDYGMHETTEGEMVAGVCHARGANANVPPQWLMYVRVPDVNASIEQAIRNGGECVDGPRAVGAGQFAIVKDPAGAFIGLYAE